MGNNDLQGHPRGLSTLFFTEMWERFSFYGMRALLVLFMVAKAPGLEYDRVTASAVYGLYLALVYLTALPGGWIADRLLGAQRAVWYGGCIIALGHFTLAIPATGTFYLGLLFIVLGTALLKPNVSVIVGELYAEGSARRDSGFTIFYMGINLGAMIGPFICSPLGEKVNWHYGFAAAGVGMVAGLIQYRLTRWRLGEAGLRPKGYDPKSARRGWMIVAAALAAIFAFALLAIAGVIRLEPVRLARQATRAIAALGLLYLAGIFFLGRLDAIERRRLIVLIFLLVACVIFFMGFEQAGSSLNLFAKDYTVRTVSFLNRDIAAGLFQSLNPVFILTFAPLMASLWVALARRGLNPSTPAKFGIGLILLGLGFVVMIVASRRLIVAGGIGQVGPLWLVATYLIHTLGELCLSPVGLSAVTKLAPRRFVGQMMGMWFLATALGSLTAGLLAGEISQVPVADMPSIYLRIALITASAGAVLIILARPLKKLMGNVN